MPATEATANAAARRIRTKLRVLNARPRSAVGTARVSLALGRCLAASAGHGACGAGRRAPRSTTSVLQRISPGQGGDPGRSPSSRPGAGSRRLHTGGSCPPPLPEDPMARILVVEDSPDVHALLVETLEAAGHEVLSAHDALAARRLLAADAPTPGPGPGPDGDGAPELVVLDLMLPHVDGSVLLSEIRRGGDLPVLVLSAKDAVYTKVDMLRLGADDYVTKPFDLAELTARIEALLRRSTPSAAAAPEPLTHGPLTLDPGTARV